MNMLLTKTATVRTHLDLSTAHVTKADMDRLVISEDNRVGPDAPGSAFPCCTYEYGAIIFVLHYHDEPEEQKQHLEEIRQEGYSEAVINLIKLAWELDVDMIRLDSDAECRDDLPTFAW